MDELDRTLDERLTALAGRVPAPVTAALAQPSRGRSHRRPFGVSMALAAGLILPAVATATAGAYVLQQVTAAPGIENPGQPLAGANMECMSPPQAAAFLATHGYTDVVWQVESGDGTKAGNRSVQQAAAPEHGYVIPGSIGHDGKLYMVVDQRTGAQGAGACFGSPMP